MPEEDESLYPDGGIDAHETAQAPTRAYVLHPDLKSSNTRRMPEHRLAEAVALATALPGLTGLGSDVVRFPRNPPRTLLCSAQRDSCPDRQQPRGKLRPRHEHKKA